MSAADLELSQTLSALKRPATLAAAAKTEAQATKVAKEFEAIFIGQMVSTMFEDIKTDGPFGGGAGESIFRSLMIDQYSKSITEQGGFGLADQVKREILRLQEMKQ